MKRKIVTLFISPPDGKKPFPHTIDTCASCGSNCWFNAEVPPDGHKMVCELVIWKDLGDCRTWDNSVWELDEDNDWVVRENIEIPRACEAYERAAEREEVQEETEQ